MPIKLYPAYTFPSFRLFVLDFFSRIRPRAAAGG